MDGPDSQFSLEPDEFKAMVESVRMVESALGDVHYGASESEVQSRVMRRSLFVVEDVKAGQMFSEHNVRSIRPGHGLHTRYLEEILGRYAALDISKGTPLSWDLLVGR
jgi:sialic acid synthase SpsE